MKPMNERELEAEIVRKGLNAPRLTPDYIDSVIVGQQFHHFEGTTVTVCCLMLKNGGSVVGESACVSPANFDRDVGKQAAFDKAREKLWELEGYLLVQRLSDIEVDVVDYVKGTP